GVLRLGFELNAGVDVFGVFTENGHVGFFRLAHRRRRTGNVAPRAQADIQVQFMAQGHGESADAAPRGSCQGALDGHDVIAHGFECFFRQPDVGTIDVGGFLASVDFHPVDLTLTVIRLGDCGVNDLDHDRADINARAVSLYIGNDRLIGDV